MVGHVAKPVDVEELVTAIQRACRARALGPERAREPARAPATASIPAPAVALSPVPAVAAKAPPENPAAPVIDWAAVAAGLGASEAFLDQLAAGLLKNLGPKPAVLRAAVQQADLPLIMREAHSIKGVAGNVKADAAFALARAVETAARQGQQACLGDAVALAAAVEQMLAAARQRVDRPR